VRVKFADLIGFELIEVAKRALLNHQCLFRRLGDTLFES